MVCALLEISMQHSEVQLQRAPHSHGVCNEIDLANDVRSLHGSNLHSFPLTTECDMETCGLNDSFHSAHVMNKFKEVSIYGMTPCTSVCELVAMMLSWIYNALRFLARCAGVQVMVISTTVTAFVCSAWFLQLQMSHLSYGNSTQSRVCWRRKRRSAVRLQRQLMAAVFLCGLANAKAMDEQPGLQEVFLQRMTSMAEVATRAAAAAAERALERSSSGGCPDEGLSAAPEF